MLKSGAMLPPETIDWRTGRGPRCVRAPRPADQRVSRRGGRRPELGHGGLFVIMSLVGIKNGAVAVASRNNRFRKLKSY